MFIKQPFDQFLGLQYERTDDNYVKITLPLQPLHFNSVGVVHGGIISALADIAMANSINADMTGKQKAVTVDLNVSFLKGAKGKYLVAESSVVKAGRTLNHLECQIFDDAENLVATAKSVYFNT